MASKNMFSSRFAQDDEDDDDDDDESEMQSPKSVPVAMNGRKTARKDQESSHP